VEGGSAREEGERAGLGRGDERGGGEIERRRHRALCLCLLNPGSGHGDGDGKRVRQAMGLTTGGSGADIIIWIGMGGAMTVPCCCWHAGALRDPAMSKGGGLGFVTANIRMVWNS